MFKLGLFYITIETESQHCAISNKLLRTQYSIIYLII